MDYEKMLADAIKQAPKDSQKTERFEIPNVTGRLEGNKTIVTNFFAIARKIERDPQHVLKFILKELASKGTVDGERLIFMRRVSPALINDKINKYVTNFVICSACKKPDTKLERTEQKTFLLCNACGHKESVKDFI
ncbi:MAG: translation initiation factor IF-2 subunit beta [Candidatus Woesearchaeota archaeon]